MQNDKNVLDGHFDLSTSALRFQDASSFSGADPEEGRRLMQAFFSIREPALRQAILTLVTELQKQSDETPRPVGDDTRFRA